MPTPEHVARAAELLGHERRGLRRHLRRALVDGRVERRLMSVASGSSSVTFTPTTGIPASAGALHGRRDRVVVEREHDDAVEVLAHELVDVRDLLVDVEVVVE